MDNSDLEALSEGFAQENTITNCWKGIFAEVQAMAIIVNPNAGIALG